MIPIKIKSQPDDVTCGPTSLHAVYSYYGDSISLDQVIKEMSYVEGGGTLAVLLACHALRRGYQATIYTYNLKMFDPTWFRSPEVDLIAKLKEQKKYKTSKKFLNASDNYLEFLKLGGTLKFHDLSPNLLAQYFWKKIPILAGLSATYLYQIEREYTDSNNMAVYDDIIGAPTGHFVVLCGYNPIDHKIVVADPYCKNPISKTNYYSVKANRLINSIMLGILTYDANFLIIEKVKGLNAKSRRR